jgi:UDP-N-acetylmuramate--alanine ligase
MKNNKIDGYKHVHFAGIGGVSMSALALGLFERGLKVSGSDITASRITKRLSDKGITVYIGHAAENVNGADLLVKNSAIRADNPEYLQALKNKIDIMERSRLLGIMMNSYSQSIAVSGAHGKTTVTGLVAAVLSDLDPTIHIGGELIEIDGSYKRGAGDIFIAEACEYCRNFLCLRPKVGVITNIDADHLDYYKNIDDIVSAFDEFAKNIKKGGYLILNGDDKNCAKIECEAKKITVGIGAANDYFAKNIRTAGGKCSFDVMARGKNGGGVRRGEKDGVGVPARGKNGGGVRAGEKDGDSVAAGNKYNIDVPANAKKLCRLNLNIIGRHQITNALIAFSAGIIFGLDAAAVKQKIEGYGGVRRRFELLGKKINGADIIIDYAHHPREIKNLLNSVRALSYKKIFCVFQPHTYTRTKMLFDDFIKSLTLCDTLVLMPIYAARERPNGMTSQILAEEILKIKKDCVHISEYADILNFLKKNAANGDVILLVGAGNLTDICAFI